MSYPHTLYKVSISQQALKNNIDILTKNTHAFFPVVKANAYGHGIIEVAKMCLSFESANKIKAFNVGTIEEAILLRKHGINTPVLALLGSTTINSKSNIELAKQYDIMVVVHNKETLQEAIEAKLSFALKWNTGMNRFGFNEDELENLLDYLQSQKNLRFEVNMSHFAMADDTSEEGIKFTKYQIEKFNSIHKRVQKKFPHALASLGQSAYALTSQSKQEYASQYSPRLGLAMYGLNPFYNTQYEHLAKDLKPVMNVYAPILELRKLKAGDSIGYGQVQVQKESVIALVGIGYAHSYRRVAQFGNYTAPQLFGVHKNTRVACIGNICMEVSFFDVTHTNAKIGDVIYVLGGEQECTIKAEELTQSWGTIPYEAICQLGKTSERIFI